MNEKLPEDIGTRDKEIRLECLRLVQESTKGFMFFPKDVLQFADQYYAWVTRSPTEKGGE